MSVIFAGILALAIGIPVVVLFDKAKKEMEAEEENVEDEE